MIYRLIAIFSLIMTAISLSAQCPTGCLAPPPGALYIASSDGTGDGSCTTMGEYVEICYQAPACPCDDQSPFDLAGIRIDDNITNGDGPGTASVLITSGSLLPNECLRIYSGYLNGTIMSAPMGTSGSSAVITSPRDACPIWNAGGDMIFMYADDTATTLIGSEPSAGGVSTYSLPAQDPCPAACMAPACSITIDSEVVSACNDNGTGADPSDDTFNVTITASVTNGSGFYTVSDMLGNSGTNTSGAAVTLGPYPANGTFTISFTAQDNMDATCTVSSAAVSGPVNSCATSGPPNDLCDNAIELPPMDAMYMGTTIGGTAQSPLGGAFCPAGSMVDAEGVGVWYTFEGTGNDWTFAMPAVFDGACQIDPEINIFSGTCGNFTCVTGDDDGGGALSAFATVPASVIGTTYFLYVHHSNPMLEECFDLFVTASPPPTSPDCIPDVGTFTKN